MNQILTQNDITICYDTFGHSKNPAAIFIMGITGQLVHWPKELMQSIADQGYYVIVFDNRDVGLSSYYDHLDTPEMGEVMAKLQQGVLTPPPYTLNDMAEDIVVLMDGLDIEKAHLIGQSLGGQIAQCFALEYPERLLSLTLLYTSSGDRHLPPPKPEVLNFFFAPRPENETLQNKIERHVEQYRIYNHPNDLDEDEARAICQLAYERANHPNGNTRQMLAMMHAEPRGEALKSLRVPTLILHGDYDPVFPPEHAKFLHDAISGSKILIHKDLGHGLPRRLFPELSESMTKHFRHF